MSIVNDGAVYGISQYRFPHNYELVGREFAFSSECGEAVFRFEDRERLCFNGESFEYECHKIENYIYFVRFGFNAAVLDLPSKRAIIIPENGESYTALAEGAEAFPLGENMVDTDVMWNYGHGRFLRRIHDCENSCLVAWSPKSEEFVRVPLNCRLVRDAVYLVDFEYVVEEGLCAPAGKRRFVMLEDYERLMFTGCIFGEGEGIMTGGYARFPNAAV